MNSFFALPSTSAEFNKMVYDSMADHIQSKALIFGIDSLDYYMKKACESMLKVNSNYLIMSATYGFIYDLLEAKYGEDFDIDERYPDLDEALEKANLDKNFDSDYRFSDRIFNALHSECIDYYILNSGITLDGKRVKFGRAIVKAIDSFKLPNIFA